MTDTIRIGTRGSQLARKQAELVAQALRAKHPALHTEIIPIETTGDKSQAANTPLWETGGKGVFLKEIEQALLQGDIDCAVHSMKDVPTSLPEGLVIPCILPREDPRDVFISHKATCFMELPEGAVVGSSSLRRQAIILAARPDLKVVTFRGNVDTRLKKLEAGEVDATILAAAGLKRLGLDLPHPIAPDVMLPAVAQGAVGIEVRDDSSHIRTWVESINCAISELRVMAERAYLNIMDGSCKTPLAALMSEPDATGRARLDALAATPDGKTLKRVSYMMVVHQAGDARRLGRAAGYDMRKQMAGLL